MKILFCYPPFCSPLSPPYTLARLKSIFKEIDTSYIDLNLEFHKLKFKKSDLTNSKEFLKNCLATYTTNNKKVVKDENPEFYDDIYKKIIQGKPTIVAFSVVFSSQTFYTYQLAKKLKKEGYKVVVGGPAVNHKLLEVAEYYKSGIEFLNQFNKIGIDDGTLDFSFVSKDYFVEKIVLPIKTTSACYYQQCSFCTHHGKEKYKEYDLNKIFENVQDNVFIIDDMIHTKRLLEIASILKEKNIKWMCQLKPSTSLTKEVLKELYDSGLRIIIWGIESGNDRILNLMKKGTNVKLNSQTLEDSKLAGIKNVCYIMFGFPGETKEEFLDTISFLQNNENNIDLISTSVFGLQKDTDVYNNFEKYNIESITEIKRTILEPRIEYTVNKGLSNKEASKLRDQYKKTLMKINKYPKEWNAYRELMLNDSN